jgi:osmotically-inducible protein OsmY
LIKIKDPRDGYDDAAGQDVRRLFGLVGVFNHVMMRPRVDVSNISDDIVHAMHRSWFFDPQMVEVKAESGRVELTGSVRSLQDRQLAAATAWGAVGVTDVTSDIVVRHVRRFFGQERAARSSSTRSNVSSVMDTRSQA